MKSDKETRNEEDIQELTILINQLQLQQRRLERRLTRIQQRVEISSSANDEGSRQVSTQRDRRHTIANSNNSRRNERNVTTIRQQSERLYNDNFEPRIGDRVRITNPRSGQHPWGTIEGFCRDGKLKIHTDIGQSITRLPKNVRAQTINVRDV